jgi:hypothetical protein
MDEEINVWEQQKFDDDISDPEEEPAPRDDEAEALHKAAQKRLVPADEDTPNDCFSEKLL